MSLSLNVAVREECDTCSTKGLNLVRIMSRWNAGLEMRLLDTQLDALMALAEIDAIRTLVEEESHELDALLLFN